MSRERCRREFLEHVEAAIESFPDEPRPAVVWQTPLGYCLAQTEGDLVTITSYEGSPGRRESSPRAGSPRGGGRRRRPPPRHPAPLRTRRPGGGSGPRALRVECACHDASA